tara:strand:+ start:1254 stop:1478 length:225 start_codon:yes stop_codon:yes gene_type:complete
MTEQTQPTEHIITLQFTVAGAELVIAQLRKLPHAEIDLLVQQTFAQYKEQVDVLLAAQAQEALEEQVVMEGAAP